MAEISNTSSTDEVKASSDKLKALGDESFVGVALTESLRDEWCDLFQLYSNRISRVYQLKIGNRVDEYKHNAPKGQDNEEKLVNDLTVYLKEMGGRVSALALQACAAIEKMAAANPGSELLLKVFDCVTPFYRDNRELSLDVGDEKISVKVNGIEQCEEHLEKLKNLPEEPVSEELTREETAKEEPKKKNKKKTVIVAVICVVAVIAGIAFFAQSLSDNTSASKSNTEQSQEGDAAGQTEEAQSVEVLGLTVYGPADWKVIKEKYNAFFYDHENEDYTYNAYLDISADDELYGYDSHEELFESYLEEMDEPAEEFDQPGCDRAAVIVFGDGYKNYYYLCNDKVYMISESGPAKEAEEMTKYLDGFVKMIDFEKCK